MTEPRMTKEKLGELHDVAVSFAQSYAKFSTENGRDMWQAAEAAFQRALDEMEAK